ncbi:hypothetical protein KVH02_07090 [Streptomyces olivaceus]|uniref:DUF5709 domain-containing protein n=1 Tax=Streptomyces olivaceus TaxID=47716 RepID=A0ABS7W070_STROV|nr:hypothetical protein [Streptomyces olivaceus]MBZ6088090.1 hypothetical protein [Streptomyces olivaceus]MBZ6095074.1 hypothetical protein [Streptomyces olivaceus]MBZ6116229.1 hypothetical protein [Streptomyces olivaceus]MBZ6150934.1 hypothetical protein [Streptomyces olivaceus]MBZ6297480.1 hypothetical protein [Streptomyces olivaceus]
MTDRRHEGPGENGTPVPRDLPDQQAGDHDDPWEAAAPTREQREHLQGLDDEEAERAEGEEAERDVPDTDEAGTGRQGAPHSGAVHPEHPVPDESPG